MPKKLLKDIAEEYDISFKDAKEFCFDYLEEDMITGKGLRTWISDAGQAILDDAIPMPTIHRGKVVGQCPNPLRLWVIDRDRMRKVVVRIPKKMEGKLLGKLIYFEENHNQPGVTYTWVHRGKLA